MNGIIYIRSIGMSSGSADGGTDDTVTEDTDGDLSLQDISLEEVDTLFSDSDIENENDTFELLADKAVYDEGPSILSDTLNSKDIAATCPDQSACDCGCSCNITDTQCCSDWSLLLWIMIAVTVWLSRENIKPVPRIRKKT